MRAWTSGSEAPCSVSDLKVGPYARRGVSCGPRARPALRLEAGCSRLSGVVVMVWRISAMARRRVRWAKRIVQMMAATVREPTRMGETMRTVAAKR
jgi:hypothetical protein